MSFLGAPKSPAPPPPAPLPPTVADASVQDAGARARQAAASAAGAQGFDGSVLTSPSGAAQPPAATKALLGS